MDVYGLLLCSMKLLIAFICPLVSSLQCYHCDDSNNNDETCTSSKWLRDCPEDMDSCSLQAMWYGDQYEEMRMVRTCMDSRLCPDGAVNSNNSSCVRTHRGLSCTMCCHGDGCNNGGSGLGFPRPPPKPPAPQFLVERLISPCVDIGSNCKNTLTWADSDTRLHVRKECEKKKKHSNYDGFIEYVAGKKLECNIQEDDTFCVTCCVGGDCMNSSTSHSGSIKFLVCYPLLLFTLYLVYFRIP